MLDSVNYTAIDTSSINRNFSNEQAFFGIGLGPIPWLIVAELFEAKYVSTASE